MPVHLFNAEVITEGHSPGRQHVPGGQPQDSSNIVTCTDLVACTILLKGIWPSAAFNESCRLPFRAHIPKAISKGIAGTMLAACTLLAIWGDFHQHDRAAATVFFAWPMPHFYS